MKAIWQNTTIAESDQTILLEDNHYFPPDSVNMQYLEKAKETYTCPLKGQADYYNIKVAGEIKQNGAWAYAQPKEGYENIAGYFSFWQGVKISE